MPAPLHTLARYALITATLLSLALPAHAAPAANLWPFWNDSDESASQSVDHSSWQDILDTYLVPGDDGINLFRYRAVSANDRDKLDAYITGLTAIDPRKLARAEQLPYWINLYNALTVQVVLDHPGEDSIRDMGGGWFSPGPWNEELVTIAGTPVTLNDIEHRILRPIWQDHHIHYVVNCAAMGCPNLAREAYTRGNTRELMESGESDYLHHPRGLRFDSDGRLHLSSIYDWYQEDFGGSRESLLDYLAGERPDLAERLLRYRQRIHYHYDWSLNDASSRGG